MRLQKPFYFLLIAIAALSSLYFWGQTARIFMANHHLNEEILARVIQWEVEEMGSDQYALKAHFTFEIGEQVYHGKTLLAKPYYLNSVAAIKAIRDQSQQSWTAWFDSKDPTRSSLEKVFPTSLLLRAALSTSVLAYFVFFLRRRIF